MERLEGMGKRLGGSEAMFTHTFAHTFTHTFAHTFTHTFTHTYIHVCTVWPLTQINPFRAWVQTTKADHCLDGVH